MAFAIPYYTENSGRMEAAKEEWAEEQHKNSEKGMMSENTKAVCNTFKALTKTQ